MIAKIQLAKNLYQHNISLSLGKQRKYADCPAILIIIIIIIMVIFKCYFSGELIALS